LKIIPIIVEGARAMNGGTAERCTKQSPCTKKITAVIDFILN